jgi:hypothetical protein
MRQAAQFRDNRRHRRPDDGRLERTERHAEQQPRRDGAAARQTDGRVRLRHPISVPRWLYDAPPSRGGASARQPRLEINV